MNLPEIQQALLDWSNFLDLTQLAENTQKQYIAGVKTFINFLLEQKIEEVTQKELNLFKENLIENYKTTTVNIKITSLNQFFSYLNIDSLYLKTEKIQKKAMLDNMINDSDYNRLMRWCDRLGKEKIKLIIHVLAGTGIRVSELEYLTAESITKDKGVIKLKNKGKERVIIIPKTLCKELKAYMKKEGITTGLIFHGKNKDKLIDKAYIWRELKAIAGKARIKKSKIKAHNFRHYFAKKQAQAGMPITQLADILGHSSLETTRLYTLATSGELKANIDNIYKSCFYM